MDNNPRLSSLFETVNLSDVLAQETQEQISKVVDRASDFATDDPKDTAFDTDFDFEPSPTVQETFHEPMEQEEPYDAEANARSLVYGIQAITTPILTTVGIVKVRQSIGGKKNIEQMRKAVAKEFSGEELSDTDKRLLEAYKAYENKMKLLSGTILPTEKETENLIRSGIHYCEESRIDVGKGLAFYSTVAGDFVSKITTLLLT